MSIFASTPPINDDPLPFQYEGYHEEPRRSDPAWDRPRAHGANPILVAYREYLQEYKRDEAADQWLYAVLTFEVFGGFKEWETPGHIYENILNSTKSHRDHASKVLTRLANFADGGTA